MKKKITSQSAFFNPPVLIGFAVCSIGVLLTLATLSKSADQTPIAMATAQTPGTWTATASMNVARQAPTATLLPDGKVLVAGGTNGIAPLSSAELYDPATGQWTGTGSMTTARITHTATLLADGRVLVAGGQVTTSLASAELYDPNTGTWTLTGSMTTPRAGHVATLITTGPLSGMVLVAGGGSTCFACTPLLASAELYDPSTGTWIPTDDMTLARYWNTPPTAATLPDGSVLVVGGVTCCPYHWFNKAESYDPENQTWTPTSRKVTDANAEPILLPDGKVLVAGGVKGTQPTAVDVADAELFDSSTGLWTATSSMSTDRGFPTLTLLTSGQALVAGGTSGGWGVCNDLTSAELYDPATGVWFPTGDMTHARSGHTATLLPNGQVLAAGGSDCEGNILSSAELYTPGGGTGNLNLLSAASRQTHRTGTFDIPLPLTGNPGVECRSVTSKTIVMTFSNNVTGADSASTSCGTITGISVDPSDAHNLLVSFDGPGCNAVVVTVTANNVHDDQGNTLASASANLGILVGDVTSSGNVKNGDVSAVQAVEGQQANASNFRSDVNLDGKINRADVKIVKSFRGTRLP
jgi:hypothetical protein